MRPTMLAIWTLASALTMGAAARADVPAAPSSTPSQAVTAESTHSAHATATSVAPTAAPEAKPAGPDAAAVAQERDEQDRVICKKVTETGTLGRKKKLCMTAEQWDAHRQAARSTMRGIDNAAGTQDSGVPGGG